MPRHQTANTPLEICSIETQRDHPELFHYTSYAALENIVKSNALWASHYADMTDKREVLLMRERLPVALAPHYDKLVAAYSRHERRRYKAMGGSQRLARDFVDSLYRATYLAKNGDTKIDAFTVSFSTHAGDSDFERENGLLNQWNGYAGPDGFCLVFDTQAMGMNLGTLMDALYWVRLQLKPVRYSDAPIGYLFPELVAASANTLRQFLFQNVRAPEMAGPEFLEGTTLLKDAAFRDEREVRIVAIPGSRCLSDLAAKEHPHEFTVTPLPEVRTRPGTNRRYISLFEGLGLRLPINRIIVGPSSKQPENAAFARSLVSDDVIVSCSKCIL